MKQIYLIRHAKSDWSDPNLDDFDRGLSPRGKKDIKLIAEKLKEKNMVPDLILCSKAKRTKRTAKGLLSHTGFDAKIVYKKDLYFCTPEHMIETIQKIKKRYKKVWLIGHNPELSQVVTRLEDHTIGEVPPLGIVGIHTKIKKWGSFQAKKAQFDFFIYPKLFR